MKFLFVLTVVATIATGCYQVPENAEKHGNSYIDVKTIHGHEYVVMSKFHDYGGVAIVHASHCPCNQIGGVK